MKPAKLFFIALSVLPFFWISTGLAQEKTTKKECRCHSKQPEIKRMHETIGFAGCARCHSANENLMSGRSGADPGRKAALAKRKTADASCIPCHDAQGGDGQLVHAAMATPDIMGTLYCPEDRMRFPSGTKACSLCGGALLDISELTERSRQSPSNEICMQCHRMEEVLRVPRHAIFNTTKLRQCLDCHKGHDDCAGCHR